MDTGHTVLDGVVNIFLLCVMAGVGISLLFLLLRGLFSILMILFGFAALPFILLFNGLWWIIKIILWPFKFIYSLFSLNGRYI